MSASSANVKAKVQGKKRHYLLVKTALFFVIFFFYSPDTFENVKAKIKDKTKDYLPCRSLTVFQSCWQGHFTGGGTPPNT